jgi:hypothetical protein
MVSMRTLLAAFLLVGIAAVLVSTGVDLVWFRDVGYPDSASLLRIGDYAHTGTIYPDPNRPPYLASLYGPMFYVLLSLPARLAGSIDEMRMLVRVAILVFWIASLVLLFFIVYRVSGSMNRGAWAIAFACAPDVIAHWTTQVRSDLPGITFSLLSIYVFLGAKAYPRLILAAFWSVLALLCKQTFLPASLAVLLYLLWCRRFAQALVWASTITFGTLLGYGAVIWKEPYAWLQLTTFAKPVYSFHTGFLLAVRGLLNAAPLFALIGALAAWRKTRKTELLLLIYCLLSWIVALTSLMQVGGSTNYFLEPLTASAAVAAANLPSLEEAIEGFSRTILIPAVFVMLCFFVPSLQADRILLKDGWFRMQHYTAYRSDWQLFVSSVIDRALLSSYPDVTIYSRKPEVPDPLLNSVLAERGRWSWNPVIDNLKRSDYELLAMYPYFLRGSGQYRGLRYWNVSLFEAVQRNYQLAGLCAGMEIWTPRHPRPGSWKYLTTEGCEPPAHE